MGSVVADRLEALGYSRRELARILSKRLGRSVPSATLDAIVNPTKPGVRQRRCRRSLLDALGAELSVSSGTLMGVHRQPRLQPGGSVLAARARVRWATLVQGLGLPPALEQDLYWLPGNVAAATKAVELVTQAPEGWLESPSWAQAADRAAFAAWHAWLSGLIGEVGKTRACALLVEHAQALREGFSRRPWQRPAPTQPHPPRKRGK